MVMVEGDAREEIVDMSAKTKADLVVMGSKSTSSLKRAFLGSVTDYCTRHCTCPVLVVKQSST